jgi:hypothetical protein
VHENIRVHAVKQGRGLEVRIRQVLTEPHRFEVRLEELHAASETKRWQGKQPRAQPSYESEDIDAHDDDVRCCSGCRVIDFMTHTFSCEHSTQGKQKFKSETRPSLCDWDRPKKTLLGTRGAGRWNVDWN